MPIFAHHTDARVYTRLIDVGRLRKYLAVVAGVAARGAEHPDLRDTVAAARILEHDGRRGLARPEGRQ